ncbi:MAG: histidine--tRNA ligase [Thermoplasmata archaeon]|nr:histidine--tRNA ligase [Thermoplasmata archaeon]
MTFTSLRGFRDYPPPDAGARSELRRRMRAVARRCGFAELETPSVESLDLFRVKSGDEIAKELWAFDDKGGRPVALVAETTPSVARVLVDRAKSEPMPVKWFTVSKLWRYEEPQAGRTREFGQFNLDIFGVAGVEADVEILACAALILDEVGAQGLYAFRLNDRDLAKGLGTHFGADADPTRFFRAIDRFRKIPVEEFRREIAAAGVPEGRGPDLVALLESIGAGVPPDRLAQVFATLEALGLDEAARAGLGRLRKIFDLLERVGLSDRVVFDPTVVRGLAYYTSTVFEAFDRSGDLRSLFGGGRYDHLVELFGGPSTPAVGLAIGDQTLELLLRPHDRWPDGEPGLDTYVIAVTEAEVPLALTWVHRLRRAGIAADGDLMARSMSKQLKEAARRRARRALILGPKEVARGVVVERDLTTGSQRELPPEAVLPPDEGPAPA